MSLHDAFWSDHSHLKPHHLKATESPCKQPLSPSLEHIQKIPKGFTTLDLKQSLLPSHPGFQISFYHILSHTTYPYDPICWKEWNTPSNMAWSSQLPATTKAWAGLPTVGHCHPLRRPAAHEPGRPWTNSTSGSPIAECSWMVFHWNILLTKMEDNWGYPNLCWLVVGPPLWKIGTSIGMMRFPIYGKIKKCSKPPTSMDCLWWFIMENPIEIDEHRGYPHDIHSSDRRTSPTSTPRRRHLARWPTFGGRSGCQTPP